jgi:acyl-coenzyme A thioesterase PaaI-like protein
MRRPIAFSDVDENRCYGCGPANPLGLRLQFFETDEGIEIDWVAPEHVVGPPGIVHGGVQGTVLDEACCMAAFAKRHLPVVTGELTVRYRSPVPLGVPLLVRARIVEEQDRSFLIEGAIVSGASGDVLTEGRGRFFAARGVE